MAEEAAEKCKNTFLQGLKPIGFEGFAQGLKPLPPKEKGKSDPENPKTHPHKTRMGHPEKK